MNYLLVTGLFPLKSEDENQSQALLTESIERWLSVKRRSVAKRRTMQADYSWHVKFIVLCTGHSERLALSEGRTDKAIIE